MLESKNADPALLFSELCILLSNLSSPIIFKSEYFQALTTSLEHFYISILYFNYEFENILKTKTSINSECGNEIRIICRNIIVKSIHQLRHRLSKNFLSLKNINFFATGK